MAPTERQKTEFKFRVLLTLRELQQATSSIFQRLLLSIKRIIGYAVAAVNLKSWPRAGSSSIFSPERYEIAIADGSGKIIFSTSRHFPIPEIFPPAAIEKVKEDGTAWVSLNFWKRQRRVFQKLFIVRTRGGVDSCSFELSKEREELIWKNCFIKWFGMAFDSSFDDNRFHFCKFTFSQFHQQTFFANSGRPFSSFEG